MNKYLTVGLIILALMTGAYFYQKYRIAPGIKFENLALTDLNGQPVKLQDYRGKKLFLNFFATWCGPCVHEFPSLGRAAESLVPDNFLFISISDEPLPLLNRFNERMHPNHIVLLHAEKKFHDLGVFTVPTNYVLNGNGQVVFEKIGDESWDNSEILEQLKRKAN